MIEGYEYEIEFNHGGIVIGMDFKHRETLSQENLTHAAYAKTQVGDPWETIHVYCFKTKEDAIHAKMILL